MFQMTRKRDRISAMVKALPILADCWSAFTFKKHYWPLLWLQIIMAQNRQIDCLNFALRFQNAKGGGK